MYSEIRVNHDPRIIYEQCVARSRPVTAQFSHHRIEPSRRRESGMWLASLRRAVMRGEKDGKNAARLIIIKITSYPKARLDGELYMCGVHKVH